MASIERGTVIAGKYELVRRLGSGGMGEVWVGRDRDLHRDVAIKFVARDEYLSPEVRKRFERESIAAAQISHPHVVVLYERGVHDGLRYMVMEHVDGITLAERVRDQRAMELSPALDIARKICAALVAAHRARIVHYDIKPSNVMLTADGGVKVVDFGIAGFAHTHTFTVASTTELTPAGTALYGAPEQFLDERGDERSDLYALGGVLFTLLTGQPPFTGKSGLSVIRRKLDEEAPALNRLRPDTPEAVNRLVSELLQRDPARRPQTAEAVHERLTELCASTAGSDARTETRVVTGVPPTPTKPATGTFGLRPPEEPRKGEKRKLSLVLVATVAAFALGAGLSLLLTSGDDDGGSSPDKNKNSTKTPEVQAKPAVVPDLCDPLAKHPKLSEWVPNAKAVPNAKSVGGPAGSQTGVHCDFVGQDESGGTVEHYKLDVTVFGYKDGKAAGGRFRSKIKAEGHNADDHTAAGEESYSSESILSGSYLFRVGPYLAQVNCDGYGGGTTSREVAEWVDGQLRAVSGG
ncbi:serine/threonine-protein kinase [Streptomyces cuspidosporus]|uniref:non-specific serine/threonine protein kinase n=1 Tax=Streptomyces cuspidosporus TaxID=66882 RepID=A0ABN3HBS1_9ACTN